MKVKEIMSNNVRVCGPTTDLARVTQLMAERNCGALPVVSEEGEVLGIITDRDICLYAGKKLLPLNKLVVREAFTANLHYCAPDDDIQTALAIMREGNVRRLPVLLPATGKLVGLLSIDDIILLAGDTKFHSASYREVVETIKAIGGNVAAGVESAENELGVSSAG